MVDDDSIWVKIIRISAKRTPYFQSEVFLVKRDQCRSKSSYYRFWRGQFTYGSWVLDVCVNRKNYLAYVRHEQNMDSILGDYVKDMLWGGRGGGAGDS